MERPKLPDGLVWRRRPNGKYLKYIYFKVQYRKRRIRGSSGTTDPREAERRLRRIKDQVDNQELYGVRPDRPFRLAAEKLIRELKATGQQSNRASGVQSKPGLFELRAPEATACLLEVDFHDSAVGVQFLTERRADAARAIAKAVVAEDGRAWVPEQPLDPKEQAVNLGLFPKDTDWAGALTRQEAAQLAIHLKDMIERA